MAASLTSVTNGFIAGFNAGMTEKLIVDYARDWKKTPALMLAGVTTAEIPQGNFVRINPEAQARLLDDPLAYLWPANTPAPEQTDNGRAHEFVQWDARRYCYARWLDHDELQFTSWDLEAQVLNDLGNQAALNRAKLFYGKVSDSANYSVNGTNHYASATSLGGGVWSAGNSANRYIQKSLAAVMMQIEKSSVNGILNMDDLFLVVGPEVADGMSRSQEIADGLHRTTDFKEYMQYDLWQNQMARYGLPPKLYGITLVVDPWIKETAKIGATRAKSFVAGSNSAYVMVKPGALKSASGGKAFGSWEFFTVKGREMVTEVIDWPIDHRKKVQVIDYLDVQPVAKEASYLITAVLS